mgnify:CR=1 FL=1
MAGYVASNSETLFADRMEEGSRFAHDIDDPNGPLCIY